MNDAGSVIIVHVGYGLTACVVQKHPTSLKEMWSIREQHGTKLSSDKLVAGIQLQVTVMERSSHF